MSDSPSFELPQAATVYTPPLYGLFVANAQNNGALTPVQFQIGSATGRAVNGIVQPNNVDFILPANKVFDIEFAWRIAGSGASGDNSFRILSVEDTAYIGVDGLSTSLNFNTNDSIRPVTRAFFDTSAGQRHIQVRQSGGLGEVQGFLAIKEIK